MLLRRPKVEWLNKERTKARLTLGWFRKVQAIVVQSCTGRWRYQPSGNETPVSLDKFMDSQKTVADWTPLEFAEPQVDELEEAFKQLEHKMNVAVTD